MHSHTVGAFEAFRQLFSHMITLPSKHMSIPIPPHHLCHTWTAQRPSLPQLSPLHLPLSPFLSTYHTTHASLAFVTGPPQCKAFCPRLLLIPSSLDTHASAWICLNEASRTWHRVLRGVSPDHVPCEKDRRTSKQPIQLCTPTLVENGCQPPTSLVSHRAVKPRALSQCVQSLLNVPSPCEYPTRACPRRGQMRQARCRPSCRLRVL